jgi:hypothetical protein
MRTAQLIWTVQLSVVVGLTLGLARVAHGVGRSAASRARLRRLVLHRAVPLAAAGLAGAGVALLVLLPRPQELPRRYADYLPGDGPGAGGDPLPGSVLGTLLIGGSLVLVAVRVWLRYAGSPSRPTSLLRHCLPGIGAALLLAGLVGSWIADRMTPVSFGWYLYSPMADQDVMPPIVTGGARAAQGIAATLAVLGLGVLTAVAAFRAGRREATGPGEP